MALLSFEVESNYEEVVRLRQEINMLENKLKSFGPGTSVSTIRSLEAQLKSARSQFRTLSMSAAQAGAELELNIRKGVNGAVAAVNELQGKLSEPIRGLTEIAGIGALGMFLNQVKNIRSEFQQMETSINVLVGEKKGQTLMNQLTEFAKVSPLDFRGTVSGAQMMLGFGIDAEKVPRFLSAIGDVAMGDAQRFNSLTLAFSQMSAAGKLMGQDLMQMVNAGFQPLEQMARDTGKSIGQLKKEMSDGKITSEMVQQAFINATSEGGKYYQMSEKASLTLGGQMSMLQDATELMFNDLGTKSEGLIMKAIQGATWLVENYQTVGRVLIGAIATFGVYKASQMAMDFAEKKAAEEKTQAVVEGYTKQLLAMEEYERAKNGYAAADLVKPNAVDKMLNGETLNERELQEVNAYTERLRLLQEEKEARDAVAASIQAELDNLRMLNAEKDGDVPEATKKYDDDLQTHLDNGMADEETIAKLQEQRDLLKQNAQIAAENLALADDEYMTAMSNVKAAQEQVDVARERKKEADELVEKLQEEYDLLKEDDLMNAPLDEYGEVTESIEALAKAEELERAEKEASQRASELLEAQENAEAAAIAANTAEERLNTASEEASTAATNLHSAAEQRDTVATNANTTATRADTTTTTINTAATNANTASTTTNTAAQGKNTLATKMATTWSKLKTVGLHLEKAATDAVTRATNALKAAWASNPFGLALTVLSTLATTLWTVFGSMEDAKEKSNQFGEAANKAADHVRLLFNVLEATDKKSKIHQDTLQELCNGMKEYGLTINDEADKLEQVNKLREDYINLLLEEGRQRDIANNLADIQNSTKKDREMLEEMLDTFNVISGDRSNEWSEIGKKIIAEDVEENAEQIAALQDTIKRYVDLKNTAFEKWTETDQKNLDNAINKYDQLVYGRANQLAQKYGSDIMSIRTSDFMGTIKEGEVQIVENYVDALIKRNAQMKEYSELQSESLAKTEALAEAPVPYSASGKGFDDLLKDIKDAKEEITATDAEMERLGMKDVKINIDKTEAEEAKKAVDDATESVEKHSATEGKTNIDSTDAVVAEENTDDATVSVIAHTATEGKTHIDATEADVARVKTEGATDEVALLDSVSAEPEIKTTWIDNFIKRLADAWHSLMEFFGIEDSKDIKVNVSTSTPVSSKGNASDVQAKRNAAKAKRDAAISELYNKAKNAKTDKDFADARKALNEYKSNLDQNSAEYKKVTKAIEDLDKRDKSKSSGKSGKDKKGKGKDKKGKGSQDDPKQRAYEAQKALDDEAKRQAELAQEERNRQRELEIMQMEDNSQKEIAQIKLDGEKKRQALEEEIQKEADILENNALQQWLKGGKGRKEYQYYAQYSAEQLAAMRAEYRKQAKDNIGFDIEKDIIGIEEAEALQKIYRADAQAMRDYLKQYGTFQQQKLAIAQDYAEKIKNAQNEGERLSFEAQRDRELRDVENSAITKQIDWYTVFDNLGLVMKGQLQPLYDQLQAYIQTAEFRESGAENQQVVIQAMERIRSQLGTNQSWQDLSKSLSDYQEALNNLRIATENDAKVNEEMARLMAAEQLARNNLELAIKSDATDEEIQKFEDDLAIASKNLMDYGTTVAESTKTLQEAQSMVQTNGTLLANTAKNVTQPISEIYTWLNGTGLSTLAELWGAFDRLKGAIDGLKGIKGVADAAKNVSEGAAEAGAELAEKLPSELIEGLDKGGLIMQIIAAVLQILDILKDGVSTLITSVIDSIFNAITGILDDILSGKFVINIGKSIAEGIGNVIKSIVTLGGAFDWIGDTNDKNLERDLELLTASNDALRRSIDDLADEMRDAKTSEMGSMYQQQKTNLEQAMANTQEMMQRSGNVKKTFLGITTHRSSNTKINDAMSSSEWSRISNIVGRTVGSASDFWNLTSEQMAKVAKDAPDLYAKIKAYADDGYGDAAQYMDEYIGYWKELEDLANAFKESLTNVSFDSVKDEFKSLLLDMESSTQDFANNFERMMQNAVINSLMNAKYNERIKQWYEHFANAMDDVDGLTAAEQKALNDEWDNIVHDAVQDRDNLKKTMGWGASSQQSSSRSLEGLSQDTGQAIEGRLTAIQISVEQIRASESQQALTLADLTDELISVAMEYSRFNVHYDNIERQLAKMFIELQTIAENTGAIVQPIIEMQADVAEIRKKTKNL